MITRVYSAFICMNTQSNILYWTGKLWVDDRSLAVLYGSIGRAEYYLRRNREKGIVGFDKAYVLDHTGFSPNTKHKAVVGRMMFLSDDGTYYTSPKVSMQFYEDQPIWPIK